MYSIYNRVIGVRYFSRQNFFSLLFFSFAVQRKYFCNEECYNFRTCF